ncbi:GMC oxidoreductase [Streptomyces sp. L7]
MLRDAPAVGTRFSDHPQLVLDWTPVREVGVPEQTWMGGRLHLSSGVGESGDPAGPGDLEILQSLVPMAGLGRGEVGVPGAPLAFLLSAQAPRPTGTLRLVSADPAVLPRIDKGMLSTPDDYGRLRAAVRTTAALLATPPLAGLSDGLLGPPPAVLEADSALDDWIAGHLATAQHTCGTVPMGPADEPGRAAVDQYGRVHGIRALRVADTSILPDAPHRGPAATAVLVGELVADAIRRDLT